MAVESDAPSISALPKVRLPDVDGDLVDVNALALDRVTVVVFACNHCPYVQSVEKALGDLAKRHPNVTWVAICSNDTTTHPDDDIPGLREQITRAGWEFPYLVDTDQAIARSFGAVCTPDFFVFARDGSLVYRGAMDDARPRQPQPVDAAHLRAAIESASKAIPFTGGKPAMGCGIKWRE